MRTGRSGDTRSSSDVDAYLARLPVDQAEAIGTLRRAIQAAAPEAVDAFSYGAPAFRYRGRPLVAYGAAKDHCSLFVMSPALIVAHRDELAAFDTSKGTIRFTRDRPLPDRLVTALVHERMAEIDTKVKK
jgi:uncharacterized protein YdhG (YjbR/CyaY superfamily)